MTKKQKADLLSAGSPAQTEHAPAAPNEPSAKDVKMDFSGGLAGFLAAQGVAMAFTSYQSGKLYLVGHGPKGDLALHIAQYPQAMGVLGNANRLYLGTLTQLVRFENVLGHDQIANGQHDKVYVPRNLQTFGNIDFHEMGVQANGVVVVVNTKFNCLCEPSITHSFKPIWKPPFISRIAPEDRCHLNGLAMVDGKPGYVTAVCRSDVVDGWRDRRADGGLIIDVTTDRIVSEGLSMPHSPRWHNGRLWVLNSGSGELGWVDIDNGKFNPLAFLPGFLRGLTIFGDYAVVGLSKPRYNRFTGLELDKKLKEKDADAWCGLQIVSLKTGDVVQWLRLEGGIQELFDVCILAGVKNPITIGLESPELRDFITIEQ